MASNMQAPSIPIHGSSLKEGCKLYCTAAAAVDITDDVVTGGCYIPVGCKKSIPLLVLVAPGMTNVLDEKEH